jgi:hypothetical protein
VSLLLYGMLDYCVLENGGETCLALRSGLTVDTPRHHNDCPINDLKGVLLLVLCCKLGSCEPA